MGLKISATLSFTTLENMFMMKEEVDIGLRQGLIAPIIQVILVDHQGFIVMVMIDMDIGLRPAKNFHITMIN